MSASELRFDDRVAVVTGAGRGLGREHALLLASRGASVVVNDLGSDVDGTGRSGGPADDVVQEIRDAGGTAVANYDSVADESGPAAIVGAAIDEYGRIDILVNNAGFIIPHAFLEYSRDDFQRLFEVHVLGTMGVTQAAWPHFVDSGYGRVVNTASPTFTGMPWLMGYATMKGAIVSLTKTLALEGAEFGIRANALVPTAYSRMTTAMVGKIPGLTAELVEGARDLQHARFAAPVAAFLAHESCTQNGELISAMGGSIGRYSIELTDERMLGDLTIEDVAVYMGEVAGVGG